MTKTIALAVMLVSGVASAGTVRGDTAKDLVEALRYAGVAPTVAKGIRTFHAGSLSCVLMLEHDVVLGDHACTVDKIELQHGAAYLLYRAMDAAGFQQQVVTDTHIQIAGTGLTCVVDEAKQDAEARFMCTGAGFGSKPHDVVITPKKRKIKDIVQPVKIEKQQ